MPRWVYTTHEQNALFANGRGQILVTSPTTTSIDLLDIRLSFDSLFPSNAVLCSDWLARGPRKREAHRLRVLDDFLGRAREKQRYRGWSRLFQKRVAFTTGGARWHIARLIVHKWGASSPKNRGENLLKKTLLCPMGTRALRAMTSQKPTTLRWAATATRRLPSNTAGTNEKRYDAAL